MSLKKFTFNVKYKDKFYRTDIGKKAFIAYRIIYTKDSRDPATQTEKLRLPTTKDEITCEKDELNYHN